MSHSDSDAEGFKMPYDPRTIANLVLKYGNSAGVKITNLSLNKIIFFLHGHYLAKTGQLLINERIEAWQYGPVVRTVYSTFKSFGEMPITSYAKRMDFKLGRLIDIDEIVDPFDLELLARYLDIYTRVSTFQLVEWSHVKGGPWDKTWNHETISNPGMIISDQDIANHFRKEAEIHGGFRA